MPRNTAFGKKFFSTFKTVCGRKTLLLKHDTRYIGVMEDAPASQKQAAHLKINVRFSLLGLATSPRLRPCAGAFWRPAICQRPRPYCPRDAECCSSPEWRTSRRDAR